jgi:uncharacterized protein involved in exopolysaccharide biosynthesis
MLVGLTSSKTYEATSKVLLKGSDPTNGPVAALVNLGGRTATDLERDLNTSVELITLAPVAQAVKSELTTRLSVSEIQSSVSASLDGSH